MVSTNISPGSVVSPNDATLELTESEQHELQLQQGGTLPQPQEAKDRKDGRPWRKDSKIEALAQQLQSLS